MPNIINIYTCHPSIDSNKSLRLIIDFLRLEDLSHTVECNPKQVMALTRGTVHPARGFVLLADSESGKTIMYNIYDLVDFVRNNGFRLCCS